VLTDNPDAPRQPLLIASDQPRAIELSLGPLAADTRVVFHLRDSDGVVNQQPIRTLIRIMADQPPQVDISLVGIGKAVTPRASLPLRGTIWDDHGLSRTWFEYQVEGREPQQEDFQLPGGGGGEEDQQEMEFEVEQAAATPGVKLSLRVQAADNYALGPQPQVGSSQQYELQVVTEAELRALLETRERILRRRFEGIMDEMARVRDSLSRLLGQGPPPRSAGLDPPGVPAGGDAPQKQEAEAAGTPSSSPSRLSRQILRTEQALQTSDRMRHETQEVADEFGRILHELEHNQVSFFDEIQQRLGQGIIAPLTEVANQQFPLLDDRLQHLRQVVEDPRARDPAALAARRQVDVLLRQMEEVLQNMLELQKFNELLADLRQIIEAQKQVSQLTVKERERLKQRLKDELRKDLLD
ncbi:MAG: hypothetical protein GTO03_05925, partial [Planctomycetales bacterium]|nr:hypothetical protein [Planctomycetales bacterium]